MESIKERILYYLEAKGISRNKAALECGLSASYFKNTNSYSAEAVAKLMAKYTELSAEWVMRGKGNMIGPEIHDVQNSIASGNGSVAGNNNVVVNDDSSLVLHERVKMLEMLLEEKERLIKVLMDK